MHMEAHDTGGASPKPETTWRRFWISFCIQLTLCLLAIAAVKVNNAIWPKTPLAERGHQHTFGKWGDVQSTPDGLYQFRVCTECGLAEKRQLK